MWHAQLNNFGRLKRGCFFALSFDTTESLVYPLDELPDGLAFCIDSFLGGVQPQADTKPALLSKNPVDFERYKVSFEALQEQFSCGNSYLANLTFSTPIDIAGTLSDVYAGSCADFRLLVHDRFTVFSPERFIKIQNGKIQTHPMKGTATAENLNALMACKKEFAEHAMTVDLLRNDLSIVAKKVRVDSFRQPKSIETGGKKLVSTVSDISGELEDDWANRLGDILAALLPAGSVSGTPKRKTVELLKGIESHDRGFFCGIFGYFDGKNMDSAVAIRFIEQTPNGFIYKSGGGITADSDVKREYDEMCEKVYVPTV